MSDEYDYGRLLVFDHAAWCGLSTLADVLDARANRRPYDVVRLGDGDPVPELAPDVRGVLVMGGPQGVPRRDQFPFMDRELAFLRGAVGAGVPVFGVCLGSQMLAHALGGEVTARETPEIDMIVLTRTAAAGDDEVFAGFPDGARQLFVHDDEVVTLPEGAAAMLSGSDGTSAWRAGDGVSYGVQFHPEVTGEQFAEWAAMDSFTPRAERAGLDTEAFVATVDRHARFTRPLGQALLGRWLDGVVGRDDPTPRRKRPAA